MRKYKIVVSEDVDKDFNDIADFITSLNTVDSAIVYKNNLIAEIAELSYLADSIPCSDHKTILKYHPKAKRLLTKNKKWNVIFYISGDFVFIEKILPSKMIID